MRALIIPPGSRWDKLVVVREAERRTDRTGRGYRQMLCYCECDPEKTFPVDLNALTHGRSTSCGCSRREPEYRKAASVRATKHGMSFTKEYVSWTSMKNRCTNQADPAYPRYGGRGITVCDRWTGENGFQNFFADMGPSPSPKHTVERKGNGGMYEPGNTKWGTRKEQSNNKRDNVLIEAFGETHTLAEWAEKQGMPYRKLHQRLKRFIPKRVKGESRPVISNAAVTHILAVSARH